MCCGLCCGAGHDTPGASGILSMVFIPAGHKAPGKSCRINQTPCLEPLKLHGSPQPTLVAKRISMFFPQGRSHRARFHRRPCLKPLLSPGFTAPSPASLGFKCSKHGFRVLATLQQPDFPPKPCLADLQHNQEPKPSQRKTNQPTLLHSR